MFKNRIVKSESNVQIQATTKTFFIISIFFSAIDKERERIFGVCWTHNSMLRQKKWRKNSRQHKRLGRDCIGGAEFYIASILSDCVYNAFSSISESKEMKIFKVARRYACGTNTSPGLCEIQESRKKLCSRTQPWRNCRIFRISHWKYIREWTFFCFPYVPKSVFFAAFFRHKRVMCWELSALLPRVWLRFLMEAFGFGDSRDGRKMSIHENCTSPRFCLCWCFNHIFIFNPFLLQVCSLPKLHFFFCFLPCFWCACRESGVVQCRINFISRWIMHTDGGAAQGIDKLFAYANRKLHAIFTPAIFVLHHPSFESAEKCLWLLRFLARLRKTTFLCMRSRTFSAVLSSAMPKWQEKKKKTTVCVNISHRT